MELKHKLGLGTVQFGLDYGISNKMGRTESGEVSAILNFCELEQVILLDTAFGYGESEQVLGQHNLSGFKIVSKFMSPNTSMPIAEQFAISTERLQVQQLYGYLAHRPMDVYENPSQWDELKELKKDGKIQKIGFSFNNLDEINLVMQLGMIPDLIQVPYNFIDNRFEKKMIELKEFYNCEIHTRSVFLQGLFFTDPNQLPDFFNPIKSVLREFKRSYKHSTGSLLKYALSKPFIDYVLVGVNNLEQLQENIKSLDIAELPKRDFEQYIPENILMPSNWPQK